MKAKIPSTIPYDLSIATVFIPPGGATVQLSSSSPTASIEYARLNASGGGFNLKATSNPAATVRRRN